MGTPSPRKVYWVIGIQGAYVRIEGFGIRQLERGPSPFVTEKQAMDASRHIWVGEPHVVHLVKVNRAWLDEVARGEKQVKVQTYCRESAAAGPGFRGW